MPPVDTLEGEQTQIKNSGGVENHSDEVLGLMQQGDSEIIMEEMGLPKEESDKKDENPSGGSPDSGAGQMWRPEAASITTDIKNTETQAAEAVVVDETPKITPISTEIPNTPTTSESTPIDSAFTIQPEPQPIEEKRDKAFGEDVTIEMPLAETLAQERAANPNRGISNSVSEFHAVASQELDKGIAKAEEKLGETMSAVEAIDKIEDPQERLEARQESAKETFNKMKEDLMAINEVLDKQLVEGQAASEAEIKEAEALLAEAEELKKQANEKEVAAFSRKTAAENSLEELQGKIAGQKAEVSQKLERLEALQDIN